MNGLPYYKRYPRDFIDGTAGMAFELKGAYSLLLDLIYMQGGRLPDDPRYIAGLLGCSVRAWKGYREQLVSAGKILCETGIISNFRADKELIISGSFQEKQRENGSKPKKNNDLGEPVAKPKSNHTDTDTYKKDISPIGPLSRRKPEVPLPDEWVPSDRNVADAISKGLTESEVEDEADRFRNYHHARASRFRDWNAAWRTWVGNIRRFKPDATADAIHVAGRMRRTSKPDFL